MDTTGVREGQAAGACPPTGGGPADRSRPARWRPWLLVVLLVVVSVLAYRTTKFREATPVVAPGNAREAHVSRPPGTHPDYDWTGPIRTALAGADRLEVRSVQGDEAGTAPDVVVEGAERISGLVTHLDVDPAWSGPHCMCVGWLELRFSKGSADLVHLTVKHEDMLWWRDGPWPGVGVLRDGSAESLAKWLADAGSPQLLKNSREEARKQALQDEIRAQFPPEVRALLFEGQWVSPAEVIEVSDGPVEFTVRACRALGMKEEAWTVEDYEIRRIGEGLKLVDGTAFGKALELVDGDPVALRGAARLAFGDRWLAKLPPSEQGPWAARLGAQVIAQGDPDSMETALRCLGDVRHADVAALLERASRQVVPRDRDSEDWHQDPGLQAAALLQRAKQGDPKAKGEIESLLSGTTDPADGAALSMGLAFLGDASRLNIELFRFRSYTLGYMGIEAIESFGGREGLDVLLQVIKVHPFGAVNEEAAETFTRLTGFKPDCKGQCRAMRHSDELEDWWRANGAAFVAKKRAEPGK